MEPRSEQKPLQLTKKNKERKGQALYELWMKNKRVKERRLQEDVQKHDRGWGKARGKLSAAALMQCAAFRAQHDRLERQYKNLSENNERFLKDYITCYRTQQRNRLLQSLRHASTSNLLPLKDLLNPHFNLFSPVRLIKKGGDLPHQELSKTALESEGSQLSALRSLPDIRGRNSQIEPGPAVAPWRTESSEPLESIELIEPIEKIDANSRQDSSESINELARLYIRKATNQQRRQPPRELHKHAALGFDHKQPSTPHTLGARPTPGGLSGRKFTFKAPKPKYILINLH